MAPAIFRGFKAVSSLILILNRWLSNAGGWNIYSRTTQNRASGTSLAATFTTEVQQKPLVYVPKRNYRKKDSADVGRIEISLIRQSRPASHDVSTISRVLVVNKERPGLLST